MNELKHLMPPKLFDAIERAGICTSKQIIILSCWDIKKVTNLSIEDILFVKNLVSEHVRPKSVTCYKLLKLQKDIKILSGCAAINKILEGGFRRGSVTEIYGESGSGKTQISLQAAAHNWPNCTVYICTEDLFPINRFEEVKQSIPDYNPFIDYGSAIFVEHITESRDLLSCVRVRLPMLLPQKKFSLIVVDSVAAPFRVESTNYIQRAEEMRELAICLLSMAQDFNLAVICINQVTAAFDNKTDMLPSLGLAWSNMVSTRLYLRKTSKTVNDKSKKSDAKYMSHIRELSVVFAPDLPNSSADFVISSEGLQ